MNSESNITAIDQQEEVTFYEDKVPAAIVENGEVRLVGDANLSKDGLRIYHVKDIVLSIVEA